MEFFKQVSIDWIGKKWYFISVSLAMLLAGVAGYVVRGGLAYGIDFTGGTVILVKFNQAPNFDLLRSQLRSETTGTPTIQRYDEPAKNTVQIRIQKVYRTGEDVDAGKKAVLTLLRQVLDREHPSGEKDFNNIGFEVLRNTLSSSDPDGLRKQGKSAAEVDAAYDRIATAMLAYRNKTSDGLVGSLDALKQVSGVTQAAVDSLKAAGFYAGPFAIKGVETVGAVVGADLRRRATLAIGLSIVGMLIYIALRFKPIYGVAAIVALAHDVAITLGLFAITQKEISLTVIAALLTLVGYSVNDTIVIFDRVRENLRLMRKESLPRILNLSVNQTLSRTIMTSGMTFLAVLSLWLFGGEVLNGFSFALVVGIIVGSYSTVAIAAPVVELWYRSVESRPKRKAA